MAVAEWVWVLPGDAVLGGDVVGRKIIWVTSKKEMRWETQCKKTYRQLWPGIYQLVKIA